MDSLRETRNIIKGFMNTSKRYNAAVIIIMAIGFLQILFKLLSV